MDATNFGRTNICIFNFKDKKVKWHPLPPKEKDIKKESEEKTSSNTWRGERKRDSWSSLGVWILRLSAHPLVRKLKLDSVVHVLKI